MPWSCKLSSMGSLDVVLHVSVTESDGESLHG